MDEEKKKYFIIGIIIFFVLIIIGFLIWFLNRKEIFKKEIGLDEDIIYMKVDEIKLLPYAADSDAEMVFESSKPSVAKIDSQGYIYALEKGRTIITIYYVNDPESKKTCEVHVGENSGTPTKDSDETKKGDSDVTKPVKEKDETVTPKATCKLSVSSDGMITATNKNAVKYGFDKNKIDSNEISKHINDIPNKKETKMEGWTYYQIKYYVENEDGVVGNCSIVVIKKCDNKNECIYELG